MGIGAAILGGAVVGAGASIFGASKQSSAAKSAASTSAKASSEAIQFQREQYEQTREDLSPWRQAGVRAIQQIEDYGDFDFNFNPDEDPSYQFRKEEGINALDSSAASRGLLLSGPQQRAVSRYGSNIASQEYGNSFNRALSTYNTNLNRLQTVAGVGQNATNQVTAGGQNMANNVGTIAMNNAQYQGQMGMTGANTWANAGGGVATSINQGMGNYLLHKYLKN